VDAADDEQLARAVGIADFDRVDRTALHRPAECDDSVDAGIGRKSSKHLPQDPAAA
jgi:hypothetical protein